VQSGRFDYQNSRVGEGKGPTCFHAHFTNTPTVLSYTNGLSFDAFGPHYRSFFQDLIPHRVFMHTWIRAFMHISTVISDTKVPWSGTQMHRASMHVLAHFVVLSCTLFNRISLKFQEILRSNSCIKTYKKHNNRRNQFGDALFSEIRGKGR
jgi:hypothetical protein